MRLKLTFYEHSSKISEQIRKSITEKLVEQIAKSVLTDIMQSSKQYENEKVRVEGGGLNNG